MNVRISPSLFPSDPELRCTWVQISPQNLTACTRQELCLSDDKTTRFGFFTIDVDVNGSRRTWCDDGLIGHSHDGQTYFYRTVSKDIYSDTINLDTREQLIFYLGRGPFARDYLCTPGKVSVVESAYCKCSA